MYKAKFIPPLSTAAHIRARTEESQEDESGERYEYVVSGAKLVCTGCTAYPNCTGNVRLYVECVGGLSNGRPRANAKHNSVDENFEDESVVYFGTCQIKQDAINAMQEEYDSGSGVDSEESGNLFQRIWNSIRNFFSGLFGSSSDDEDAETVESPSDLSDDCAIEFLPNTYWEDYAQGVEVDGKVKNGFGKE